MYKVGICGHFGDGVNLLNGQTVKTKIITDELKERIGAENVDTVDSYRWNRKPIRLLFDCFQLVRRCNNIIIMPAKRGVKVFVPLFLVFNKIYHRNLHYVVIGGWLPDALEKNAKLREHIKRFKGVYVETHSMINKLKNLGLNNVFYLPNFKRLKEITESELIYPKKEPYKLCTFSRVMKEKGIEQAIEAVIKINSEMNRVAFTLDIYGQIEEGYRDRFKELVKNFPDYISYKGLIDYDKSTEVLKYYFALLFPTNYRGEGFPGTVIDAFASGVPVIATNWKYNSEVIKNGQTGFIYNGGVNELIEILREVIQRPEIILSLKKNCILEAQKYKAETVINEFIEKAGLL